MADNTQVSDNPVIAADEISGAKYQRVKPSWGVDGTAVDTSASNPLPVQVSDGTTQASVTATGTNKALYIAPVDGDGNRMELPQQVVSNAGTVTGNTAAYTIGDSYHSSHLTFAGVVAANGRTGHLLNAICYDEEGKGATLRLHLFRDTITAQTLNTALGWSAADNEKAVGYIDFDTWVGQASGDQYSLGTFHGGRPIAFPTGASVDDLYGVLEVLTATTWTGTTPLNVELMSKSE